ncbi:MAG: hypothetical protein NTW55_06530 [Planctomycetota bacterium]|nr:hypothetical protein [Planctomycetota bacterium]
MDSKESLKTAAKDRAEKAYRWVKRGLQYCLALFVLLAVAGILALSGLEMFAVALGMIAAAVGGFLSIVGTGFIIAGACMGFVAGTVMKLSGNYDGRKEAKRSVTIGVVLICVILILGLVGVFTPREGQSVIHRFLGWIGLLIILEWLTTSTWVGFEAKALMEGIPRAELRRISGGMDPGWWALLSTICWVIGFPWYLMKRGEYIAFH